MQEAVYGLLGALGGAAVTAGASYWGPLQIHKHARQDAESDRQLASTEAARELHRTLQQMQVARVVLVRRTVSAWCQLIERTYRDLRWEGPPEGKEDRRAAADRFEQLTDQAREEATTAIYEALQDGLYIRSRESSTVEFTTDPSDERGEATQNDGDTNQAGGQLILDALDYATAKVLILIRMAPDDEQIRDAREDAGDSVSQATDARDSLVHVLMGRVQDIVDVDIIDAGKMRNLPQTRDSE